MTCKTGLIRSFLSIGIATLGLGGAAVPAATPEIELIGKVAIDGDQHDLSHDDTPLEDGSPSNQFGGLSGIEYTGIGNRFLLLADRGAGDGEVNYQCRYHEAEITVDPASKSIGFALKTTRMLSTPTGEPLVGSIEAHEKCLNSPTPHPVWTAFDPESVRLLPDKSLLISDEYGPHIVVVDESGRISNEFTVPDKFRLRAVEDGVYTKGVYSNRGLEGIAVTPSGSRMIALPQSPLIQDAVIENGYCIGLNCRCVVFDGNHNCISEIVYQLDNLASGTSEILAVDEDRFLVLERDSKAGREAKTKAIFLIDTTEATDVTRIESLPKTDLPSSVTPAHKSLFIDLLDPKFGLGGEHAHEKPEGLCWGPRLPDGRRTLWVCCDNDFEKSIQTEIYCFAIDGLDR
ncbi:esterase-like activity of phytase family protein [Novipirellula caenicola]|uniref:Phytase-like domain-containing protein n=1 Tax=Novipirellula caenicola TaxID=1536901 RepID=A0ABP9VWG2_9BACT